MGVGGSGEEKATMAILPSIDFNGKEQRGMEKENQKFEISTQYFVKIFENKQNKTGSLPNLQNFNMLCKTVFLFLTIYRESIVTLGH